MTPEQIRKNEHSSALNGSDGEFWLREIAAQLAEMNEVLSAIYEKMKEDEDATL